MLGRDADGDEDPQVRHIPQSGSDVGRHAVGDLLGEWLAVFPVRVDDAAADDVVDSDLILGDACALQPAAQQLAGGAFERLAEVGFDLAGTLADQGELRVERAAAGDVALAYFVGGAERTFAWFFVELSH